VTGTGRQWPKGALALAAGIALGSAACGEDEPRRVPGTPDPEHVREVARDPYLITCADLARQTRHPESAKLVIRAEFALARVPELRRVREKETLNRTGRSVYFALTEICKGKHPAFEPARPAVEAVRRGEYRAARNRPG
jgi:hypothetical protein